MLPNINISINKTYEVTRSMIANLLCSAIEVGGSKHWIDYIDAILPPSCQLEPVTDDPNEYFTKYIKAPLSIGGALKIYGLDEGEEYTLNLEKITEGLQIMSEKYPKDFENIIKENDDAETADVFMQCCLLGEVVYS